MPLQEIWSEGVGGIKPCVSSSAIFDRTGAYRYLLRRQWQRGGAIATFILLNPSTADAQQNDPTIRRCLGFAQAWGFGAMEVVNLFAYRATHPSVLRQVPDPVGAENDHYVREAVAIADQVILAWGSHGSWVGRDRTILQLLTATPNLYCLGRTQSGQPRHPLYLRHTQPLIPFSVQP